MRLPATLLVTGAMALLMGCHAPHRVTTSSIAPRPTAAAHLPFRQKEEGRTPARPALANRQDAAPKGPLTLERAVQRAVEWHPAIAEAHSRLRQQKDAVVEARSGYLPRVGWGIDTGYDAERSGASSPSVNITGSQVIYDFGKVAGAVSLASAGVDGRKSQVLRAVDDIARDASFATIEIQRNRMLAGIARDQIKDTTSIMTLVRSRTKRGAGTRSDQLQAEARVQAAQSTLLEIEGQLQRWEGVLATLTGSTGRIEVSQEVPGWLASSCSPGQIQWERVPAIMQADSERAAALAQIGLARAEGLPTLSLEGRAGSELVGIGSVDPSYRIGLNVSGSLYNGRATASRKSAAVHGLGASKAAAARARVDVQRNLLEASSRIGSMQQLLRSLSGRQSMMRETRDLYRTQYVELGTRTLLDLLNADQELHAARFDATNVEHDLRRLNIDCTYNLGRMREAFSLNGRLIQGVSL